MTTSDPTTSNSDLAGLRKQIDEIDDKLVQLLSERTRIVQQVGQTKHKSAPGACPIRSGREAEMVRRITGKLQNDAFPAAAAAAIWRTIIGASISVESALSLSVFVDSTDESSYWLAREYFGNYLPISRQSQIKRVIGDVMDGKALVGVIPMLKSTDTTHWWTQLTQLGADAPKIFAYIPFVHHEAPRNDAPACLAIARITPEATGDDSSLIMLETDHNVSQHRLQTLFSQASLPAQWIQIATLTAHSRHHLLQVNGLINAEHAAFKTVLSQLGSNVLNVSYLGAFANPLILKSNTNKDNHHAKQANGQ
ncbi:MAG: chorismate mutase [Rickettsiales bacterium]|nr:chorismate mutase [Rickettsiales bacterium]